MRQSVPYFRIATNGIFWFYLSLVLLGSCGGGGNSNDGEGRSVASIQIDQTGLLLTSVGDSRQLSARAMDAQGNVLDIPISWTSTTPADISVDSDGIITAIKSNGSSQIVAQADSIDSAPLLIAVTTLPSGAIALTDVQIVGDPVEADPNAAPSFSNTYDIVLEGVSAPAIGSLLINTESKPVVGRVVSVNTNGNLITVTLALVSLREAFPNLSINEIIDLSQAEIKINPDISVIYNVSRSGNTFAFTPKTPAARARAEQALNFQPYTAAIPVGTSIGPPFTSCELSPSSLQSAIPIQLSAPPLFNVTINPSLDIQNTSASGLERFVVNAEPKVTFEGGVTVTASFEGKIGCKVELYTFTLPAVGGPLSLFLGGLLTVGVGIEAGGKITVATMGLGTKLETSVKTAVGLACPNGSNCEFVSEFSDFDLKMTPSINTPGIGDLRLEPSLTAFGYVEANVGNPFLQSLQFKAFKAQAGGKLGASFAIPVSQLSDATYKSDYTASLEGQAGYGTDLNSFLSLVGLSSITGTELKISTDVAKSPNGTVTADNSSFVSAETIHFHVALEQGSTQFLGIDNVKEVQLIRQSAGNTELIDTISASPSQTSFDFSFTSSGPGSVSEFSAFVITKLLPFDIFALEVDQAKEVATGVILKSRSGSVSSNCNSEALSDDGANESIDSDDPSDISVYQPEIPSPASSSLSSAIECNASLTDVSGQASGSASLAVVETFGTSSVVDTTGITELTALSVTASATQTLAANVAGAIPEKGEKRAQSNAGNSSAIYYVLHVPAGVSATATMDLQADSLASAQAEAWGILDGATDWLPGSGSVLLCPSSPLAIECLDQTTTQSVFGPFPGPATLTLRMDAGAGGTRYIDKKSVQAITGEWVIETIGENGSWSGSANASMTVNFSPTF